ncbi:hypothetical protein KM043_009790 [Ampulex compressa]|nr:hypothetical protein KM043_009790 [Ampulex compressa]
MSSVKRTKLHGNDMPLDLSSKAPKLPVNHDLIRDDSAILPDVTKCKNLLENDNTNRELTLELPIAIPDKLLSLEYALSIKLQRIKFRLPVEYVYNPVEYAYEVHAMYIKKYCNGTKKILFLGMNPGPWGMSQTGVPFGEITMVRDWLRLSGKIGKPVKEQPDRKVTGFECSRSEISGRRFWGLFQEICGDPEKYFEHAYLHNYCPLALMDNKGRNITPVELKGEEQQLLHTLCDETLADIVRLLKVDTIIGIGRYAEKRALIVVKLIDLPIKVLFMPHPSPRAVGNENWNEKAVQKLKEFNLLHYFDKQ